MRALPKFVQSLKAELNLHEKLITLLTEERAQIVTLKQEELNILQQKKQKILDELLKQKNSREIFIQEMSQQVTLDPRKSIVPQLIEVCEDNEIKKSLKNLREELLVAIQTSKRMSTENSSLIRHSLGLVSSTLSIMRAKPTVNSTNYSKDGKLPSTSDDKGTLITSFNRSV